MPRPNVVFLLTDDQRFDTIAALGNTGISTPNMDELVGRGCAMTNAHIPGGTCGAVCMPSRAMIHTGRSLFRLRDHGASIPEDASLLGETLREAGYETCGLGKWHNGRRAYSRSFTTGGEIFFGGMWDHWNVPACSFDPTGRYDYSVPYISDAFHSNSVDRIVSDHITPGTHSTDLFADFAVDWIGTRKSIDPFFLYCSFMAPHDPRSMPERFRTMYDPASIAVPENFAGEHAFDFGIRSVRDETLAPYPREVEDIRRHIAEYYAMISHVDDRIGSIVSALKARGEYENTIFILAGDNGLALGQHGLMGKQNAYEHSIRVPLVFAGPGFREGTVSEMPCYLHDIYPTICDALGLPTPDTVDGGSLLHGSDRSGGSADPRDTLYFAYAGLLRAVKKGGYKLIEYAGSNARYTQLFDTANDPWERRNLADSDSHTAVLAEMRQTLRQQRREWGDVDLPVSEQFWGAYEP